MTADNEPGMVDVGVEDHANEDGAFDGAVGVDEALETVHVLGDVAGQIGLRAGDLDAGGSAG